LAFTRLGLFALLLAAATGCGEGMLEQMELDDSLAPFSESALTAVDRNGVAYIPFPKFQYSKERFDFNKNFKGNGSMRHDFEGTVDANQCVLGYFMVGGSDDEISAKLGGGPHTDSNKDWADTYDIGVTNFAGTRSRLRYEKTHPSYTGGVKERSFKLGDVRNRWVGALGCKMNIDVNYDGTVDFIRVLAGVDPAGLVNGRPANRWVKTYDAVFRPEDVQLKSPTIPYVVKIGQPKEAQATIRVDGQGSGYKYQFVTYRALVQTK
jgi:hypothetical protein